MLHLCCGFLFNFISYFILRIKSFSRHWSWGDFPFLSVFCFLLSTFQTCRVLMEFFSCVLKHKKKKLKERSTKDNMSVGSSGWIFNAGWWPKDSETFFIRSFIHVVFSFSRFIFYFLFFLSVLKYFFYNNIGKEKIIKSRIQWMSGIKALKSIT